ncbi:hypothetical protein LMG26411_07888 [Cupriavidus numazuensis]|uniref:Uncharacterized protein n=1 Tax=Cupriavidus numazuensis TaxID=221992 RepID=A0ABM8TW37_9BURK|nr:hypothetical protein LMG26411_07888 [Cupriavidus numazuensis]
MMTHEIDLLTESTSEKSIFSLRISIITCALLLIIAIA